jgi:ABC-2 type transport system ATP-binding protein
MQPIVASGLVRRFGAIEAVAGIDLAIDAGEVFGFLGPNGAGKSTTVRVLTTLLKPTAGRAQVAGHDVVHEADAVRRAIGVALQEAAIDPLMTGRELLHLQAVLHGIDKQEGRERALTLLETVGLTAAADRRVGTYSGGMRRRLDLALALVHAPQVLFLDEPTTGLDPNSRATLWDEVRKLNRELGTTVFLTTQYMEEADVLAGRIAIIDGGRIVAEGTPAALKAKVGDPTLRVALAPDQDRISAEAVLLEFGEPAPDSPDYVAIRLHGGASRVAAVSRGLEEAGIAVAALELRTPSLDDVFQIATGRKLEGAEPATESIEESAEAPK